MRKRNGLSLVRSNTSRKKIAFQAGLLRLVRNEYGCGGGSASRRLLFFVYGRERREGFGVFEAAPRSAPAPSEGSPGPPPRRWKRGRPSGMGGVRRQAGAPAQSSSAAARRSLIDHRTFHTLSAGARHEAGGRRGPVEVVHTHGSAKG